MNDDAYSTCKSMHGLHGLAFAYKYPSDSVIFIFSQPNVLLKRTFKTIFLSILRVTYKTMSILPCKPA